MSNVDDSSMLEDGAAVDNADVSGFTPDDKRLSGLANFSLPVLSSSAPELQGEWTEVKRRVREKAKSRPSPQKDQTQVSLLMS